MEMEEKLQQCFEDLGIFLDNIQDFDIDEDIEDSLEFISLIVGIEDAFEIEIPDEYLNMSRLRSAQDLINMIEVVLSESEMKLENENHKKAF
ncbi:hypothetical protein OfM1_13370 [Lactovum odontotermitis]